MSHYLTFLNQIKCDPESPLLCQASPLKDTHRCQDLTQCPCREVAPGLRAQKSLLSAPPRPPWSPESGNPDLCSQGPQSQSPLPALSRGCSLTMVGSSTSTHLSKCPHLLTYPLPPSSNPTKCPPNRQKQVVTFLGAVVSCKRDILQNFFCKLSFLNAVKD